jgi:hypothetical protein
LIMKLKKRVAAQWALIPVNSKLQYQYNNYEPV